MVSIHTLTAAEVMSRWHPGSYDPPWGWTDEIADLESRDADRLAWIAAHHMHVPIEPGNDGRIWEGHHRIVVAARTGQPLRVDYSALSS